MPMVTMPGLSSGLETDEIIEKLKSVEERPIYRYNEQIEVINLENAALEQLNVRTAALQKALKPLYDHNSPFEQKIVEPSEEGYIEGVARKDADISEYEFEILNLASALTIHSRVIDNEEQLDASSIQIGEEEAQFEGGTVDELRDFINKEFSEEVKAKTVRKSSSGKILVIESKKEGVEGIPEFSDSANLFYSVELVWDNPMEAAEGESGDPNQGEPQTEVKRRRESEKLHFDPFFMTTLAEGEVFVSSDGKTLELKGGAGRRFELTNQGSSAVGEKKKVKGISFTVIPSNGHAEPVDRGPFSLHQGPVNSLNVKGIVLNSYNISRDREAPELAPNGGSFGVEIPGVERRNLTGQSGRVQIPLEELPPYIDFFTQGKEVRFEEMELVYEVEEEVPKEASQQSETAQNVKDAQNAKDAEEIPEHIRRQRERFPHIIKPAQNALMKLDGVEVERQHNEKIDDLIDGAILELKKETKGPVMVSVTGDVDASLDKLYDFIDAYNALLEYSRMAAGGVKLDKAGEYGKVLQEGGPLVTDSTVRILLNGVQRRVHDPYPSIRDPHIKILSALGITTGDIGSAWGEEVLPEGYLEIDEELFTEVLLEHPKAVREFFGVDTNGDRALDNGMAYMTYKYLEPYTRPMKGIITARIESNEERIDNLNDEIEKTKEHADRYEQQLRDKFGYMESVIQEQKSTEKFIQQRFATPQGK